MVFMKFDLKKNQGFLIVVGVAFVLLIVCIVMWRVAAGGRDLALAEYDTADNDYQTIVKRYNGEPTADLVKSYKGRVAQIQKEADDMRNAVKVNPLSDYSPTSFKVALKNAADKYLAIRTEKNVPTPDDFGWGEFRGGKDPGTSEMPKLVRQFTLTEDVVDILFKNDVEEILDIDRNPEGEVEVDIDGMDIDIFTDGPSGGNRTASTAAKAAEQAKKMYNAVPVKFMFRISPDKLYPILAELRNRPQFYRIRTIKTRMDVLSSGDIKDPTDINEILVVDMIIDHIKLL